MQAVFIDRDGTIIEEVNYLSNFNELKIFNFTFDAIKILKNLNFKIIIITNQSGIARGYFTQEFVENVNNYLCKTLGIDDFFYCPHLPDDNCICRKPKIGLIKNVLKKYPEINLKKSFFIGDKEVDIETGINSGTNTILVQTGYGKKEANNSKADFIVKNVYYASLLIQGIVK